MSVKTWKTIALAAEAVLRLAGWALESFRAYNDELGE